MIKILLLLFLITSCSLVENKFSSRRNKKIDRKSYWQDDKGKKTTRYRYIDVTGRYKQKRTLGVNRSKNYYYIKELLDAEDGDFSRPIEKKYVISKKGILKTRKGDLPILRPYLSYYETWIEGEKYVSKIELIPNQKALKISHKGPKSSKVVQNMHKFPTTRGVFCFYSQVIECIRETGFLDYVRKNRDGEAEITVIWDLYPYLQERMKNIPEGLFSSARFVFEEQTKSGDLKFNLELSNQIITYLVDDSKHFKSQSWPNQGILKERR